MVETKYGCVTLLDALGTCTASTEQTRAYLTALADIKEVISRFEVGDDGAQAGRVVPEHPGDDFRIRFFGDSILITLPFDRERLNWVPIARMVSGVGAVVATALSRRILFRGALAIGEYIESEDAVLGPAVLDAAHWYEMADMFGVIATPSAMFPIRRLLADPMAVATWPAGAVEAMGVPYAVPLKTGRSVSTNVADWTFSARVRSELAGRNIEEWFFTMLQDALVSPEVEAKYRHSLEFLRHCARRWGRRAEQEDEGEPG